MKKQQQRLLLPFWRRGSRQTLPVGLVWYPVGMVSLHTAQNNNVFSRQLRQSPKPFMTMTRLITKMHVRLELRKRKQLNRSLFWREWIPAQLMYQECKKQTDKSSIQTLLPSDSLTRFLFLNVHSDCVFPFGDKKHCGLCNMHSINAKGGRIFDSYVHFYVN